MAIGSWVTHTHPTYTTLEATWKLLQEAYRGDGGFLNGDNLVAHPREIIYKADTGGFPTTDIHGYRDKFTRRKTLARYENFARTIVDTFIAHLFAKTIQRDTGAIGDPLETWWQDVDGAGTHIADWMAWEQALAFVYGHVVTILDLPASDTPARTRAEQGAPALRCYSPLDVLDWIWADGRFQALKLAEAVPRANLEQFATSEDSRGGGDGAPVALRYVVWTPGTWTRHRSDGSVVDSGTHGFGVVPAVIHRARTVPGMPYLGGTILGDPKLHKDHYNLVSELRELLRSQTFSMLNIQLAPDEEVGAARARLGDAASVETIVWSKGAAGFIAPPDGPASVYQEELTALERKLYRMAGLPYEGDSASAESADSRRLKAMDLNRLLAMYADEAERVEYQLVALWLRATRSLTDEAAVREAMQDVVIHYPDEFATIDTAQAAADTRDVVTMGLGPTATAEAKKRAVNVVLPDLDQDTLDTVEAEIDAAAKQPDPAQASSAFRARLTAAAPVAPTAGGDEDGTQMQDAGARA